ncbi:exonuclease domain-containing protein [Methylobacterium sp. WCS2018Hpa-22]|uniref:exonuclease domain-containing protein n=1 Tax=Methylobacterium sp. WCS2018Hpa-22 TaxID=3073633 RepID=UPI00288B87DB|nr:exonuclease domain-containing protein [Methylobacterium sp. WCS2018Hpa-22]
MDFVALDIETANADQSSICAIGLVSFKGGQIIDERHLLVDPDDEFSPHHVRIHGITAEHVRGKPTVPQMLAELGETYKGATLLHHGPFDRTAFRRAFHKHTHTPWACNWLDSLMVARRTWFEHAGMGGYGLKFLAKHYGIPLVNHHDAVEDARAAGLLFIRASKETGLSIDEWFDRVAAPIGAPRIGISGPAQALEEVLKNETIVITGALQVMERKEARERAVAAGFKVGENVTAKTTILVVGNQDVRRLAGKSISNKQSEAEKRAENGQSIRIVTESDFLDLISFPLNGEAV